MVWNVAYQVTGKDGKKLDAEVETAPTKSEIESELTAANLGNLVYQGIK